ncbi:hypothetical protein [Carnobacterium divergens]|uniref:hypothetical protein n=1 Tax=Carnobacterium divergens TaxID=2748 RepID=UPI0007F54964|nr:hypothetical protein [Carnobacterium divergens]SBO18623.1 hypothetical protein CDIV41_90006 [Carnobacterium divergens]
MTDKKYTHKIVMFDVNGLVRTARFISEEWADNIMEHEIVTEGFFDSSGTYFKLNNIVQINPVEVIEG